MLEERITHVSLLIRFCDRISSQQVFCQVYKLDKNNSLYSVTRFGEI